MKRNSYFLLLALLITLWGCPTKRLVPDQAPPQPQIQQMQNQSQNQRQDAQFAYDWLEVLHVLKGMAPLVGPAPWFFEMMA